MRTRVVFIGGYFFDPFLLPHPWWSPSVYPHRWGTDFVGRAEVRVIATPREAAVYVDGYYAGIVDDFDGLLQALPLLPGGHTITLYLEGYRTLHRSIYLSPGAQFKLRERLERLPYGVRSEPPRAAAMLPPPPSGTYIPRQAPPRQAPTFPDDTREETFGFGILSIHVHPLDAVVTIDGDAWFTTKPGELIVHLAAGRHIVTVTRPTYQPFSTEVDVQEGETSDLNVSLPMLGAR